MLYLLSRIITALMGVVLDRLHDERRLLFERPASSALTTTLTTLRAHALPLQAMLVWGTVMWLFRYHPVRLQPSLRASMTYLYLDSTSWTDLRTLLWHNK